MGKADFLKLGDYNGICQQCGKKFKASNLKRQWDGVIACPKCWDYRHPQEFVRAKADKQYVDMPAPETSDTFI